MWSTHGSKRRGNEKPATVSAAADSSQGLGHGWPPEGSQHTPQAASYQDEDGGHGDADCSEDASVYQKPCCKGSSQWGARLGGPIMNKKTRRTGGDPGVAGLRGEATSLYSSCHLH